MESTLMKSTLTEDGLNGTYDSFIMLSAISDTVCPEWMEEKLQALISECCDRMPDKFIMDFGIER